MGLGPEEMTPRVSVIVPVRDRRDLLRDLSSALAAQTYRDAEVIVVDDGSTDGSAAIAEASGAIVVRTPGVGAVAAREAGVRAARGEILAFTDSDCRPLPGWLAAGVAAIDAGADVVQGATRPARPPRPLERTVAVGVEDGLYATCNVFYRRSAYDVAGGFDRTAASRLRFRATRRARGLGFGEDTLLGWRVRRHGRAAFAPDAVVEHHVFEPDLPESLSRAWMAGAFPALVRDVPELRDVLLRRRLVLGRASRLPLYGAAVAACFGRRTLAEVAVAVWAVVAAAPVVRREPSWRRRAVAIPASLALDAVQAAALVVGSARAVSPVL